MTPRSAFAESLALTANTRYSVGEIYRITYLAARTARGLRGTAVGRDARFRERIMLAVTEVNGCALCSYQHAKMALDAGMDEAEVRALIGGASDSAPIGQLPAIAFGQHYADSRGAPDPEAWEQIVATYGTKDASGVLAAVRMMMWGNAVGLPISSLRTRLRGRPEPGSSLRYEVSTILGAFLATPAALLHAGLAGLLRVPVGAIGDPR